MERTPPFLKIRSAERTLKYLSELERGVQPQGIPARSSPNSGYLFFFGICFFLFPHKVQSNLLFLLVIAVRSLVHVNSIADPFCQIKKSRICHLMDSCEHGPQITCIEKVLQLSNISTKLVLALGATYTRLANHN